MPGTLFVVATPIGNLEDITLRALRVLREVDLIAAEDTRRTSKLLAHYEIRKPLMSLHEHNERRETPRLVERLKEGKTIALVSDAGTPAISDPGAHLVGEARRAGVTVTPVPGPSSITAALSVSGIERSEFTFLGFPPASGTSRTEWLEAAVHEPRTVVFFEAPHRIARTVGELTTGSPTRPIVVIREISKIHEELAEQPMLAEIREQGEYVLILAPLEAAPPSQIPDQDVLTLLDRLVQGCALTEDQALRAASAILGIDERTARKAVKKAKILVKQQNAPPLD